MVLCMFLQHYKTTSDFKIKLIRIFNIYISFWRFQHLLRIFKLIEFYFYILNT